MIPSALFCEPELSSAAAPIDAYRCEHVCYVNFFARTSPDSVRMACTAADALLRTRIPLFNPDGSLSGASLRIDSAEARSSRDDGAAQLTVKWHALYFYDDPPTNSIAHINFNMEV